MRSVAFSIKISDFNVEICEFWCVFGQLNATLSVSVLSSYVQ